MRIEEARQNVYEFIDVLHFNALSDIQNKNLFNKELTNELIEKFLSKRGYIKNVLLDKTIYTKGFVCVAIHEDNVHVWHDVTNSKIMKVNSSLLTGLPITLNYFERLN